MPEIPEIEILKRESREQLVGKRVTALLARPSIKPRLGSEASCDALAGTRVSGADRRGKMLILRFDQRLALVIHLMLRGRVLLTPDDDFDYAKSPVGIRFDDKTRLEFRQVGLRLPRLVLSEDLEALPEITKLGIDALSPDLTLERFRAILKGRRGAIKALLQDQEVIAGLGNTYVNELLYASKVHPERDVRTLSQEEIEAIYCNIGPTLQRGIELGGSSAESFLHLDGTPGHFHEQASVFRREGQPCRSCGTIIQRTEIGGRGSFFCPKCQK
ncbi:MAG: bifunctional DNA-formamidopyrimidine glycosylase/DNA-(apurinic or apyrimidinic site) lyase [Dehalococcoidia bacterium]|nr:bifunctional DNA-formamidopyrimidine glycosylase/DNA-(apurinic or apyrimidinic site) lyase [Dehalococcoidia bacterium]